MTAFYNEIDPYAAQWLRNLIAAGYIAPGVVDERSIEDIKPEELYEFTQCHFFAGIGVWSLALRTAGWPDDRPVWTGSCPCQPFSAAGAGAGFADERHLWPAFHHLIAECHPAVVLGEQVASSHVGPWIDLVQADVEALDYAFGGVPFPSAGVGAPHIRDRLYWVADAEHGRREAGQSQWSRSSAAMSSSAAGGLANIDSDRQPTWGLPVRPGRSGRSGRSGRQEQTSTVESGYGGAVRPGPTNGYWRDADWLGCRDGKWRPVEPGTFPLAHGATARVGRLRAYGNAINAEAARVFIEAVMECMP